jgi:hypothetical protein
MATTIQTLTHTLVAEADRVRWTWYSRGKGRPYPAGLREQMTETIARLRVPPRGYPGSCAIRLVIRPPKSIPSGLLGR